MFPLSRSSGCCTAFDHDDGSRYFHDENNFFVFGGSKNFMGSFKINANNWCVPRGHSAVCFLPSDPTMRCRPHRIIFPEHQSVLDGPAEELAAARAHMRASNPNLPGLQLGLGAEFKIPFCSSSSGTVRDMFSGTNESWVNNTCVTGAAQPFEFECGPNNAMPSTRMNTFSVPDAGKFSFGCHGGPQSLPLASWQKLKNEDGTFREAGSKVVGMRTDAELAAAAHALLRF